MPYTLTIKDTIGLAMNKENLTEEEVSAATSGLNWIKQSARTSDVVATAVFLASDRARMLTGTVVNAFAGAAAD